VNDNENSLSKRLSDLDEGSAQMADSAVIEEDKALDDEKIIMSQSTMYIDPAPNKLSERLVAFMKRVTAGLVRVPIVIVIFGVCLITLLVQGYRLNVAPDVFSDEGVYLLVSLNIAKGFGPVLMKGHEVFLWHPPLYMLIESVYIKLAGLTNANMLTAALSVRYLNIIFSALTAGLLILFGRKLHSYKAGLIMALLFLMDPYVQRINRRNMLETLAMLFVLLGFYFFFTRRAHLTKWQRLASGTAFGLALLTKEPMLLELCALIVYVLWSRRSQLRDIVWTTAIAFAIYLIYPAWLISVNQERNFLAYFLFGAERVVASATNHTAPVPSSSIVLVSASRDYILNSLWLRLSQYGTSYLLIAFAALFTGILFVQFRDQLMARYLIVWSIFSFGLGLVVGRVSDQYFYYLMVPSIIIAGYVLALHFDLAFTALSKKIPHARVRRLFSWASIAYVYRGMWRPVFLLFVVMFLCNGLVWTMTYVVGSDDAYMNVIRYVETSIPHNTDIEASDDVAVYYLSPPYNILLDRDVRTILDRHARYFIMSAKDAWGGYDGMTPQLYHWIIENSHPLFVQNDLSFWTVGVYRLNTGTTEPLPPLAQQNLSPILPPSSWRDSSVPLYPFHLRPLQIVPIIQKGTYLQ
jgi:4-amino-4-deoxy-L-arabinose transferase-like glycosyltransferase